MGAIVGVVLAAGPGTRFDPETGSEDDAGVNEGESIRGGNKLLATIDDEPIVRRAALTLVVDEVDRTIGVVARDDLAVRDTVAAVVDETVDNPVPAVGQGRSVALGARRAAAIGADAAVFLPGDMPLVDKQTTRRLVAAYRSTDDSPDTIVPTHDGRRGNPVLFDAAQFEALESLSGDVGGRALFDAIDVRRLPVEDPGIHRDVDTTADLERLRRSIDGD